ncbi:MAG: hypothetical protein U0X73_17945 [Thermoanaerobaculia bacterium]
MRPAANPRPPYRPLAVVSICLLAALAGGCFEPPVIEVLVFEFTDDGRARAELEIALAAPDDFEGAATRRRIEAQAQALLAGDEPWLDDFARLEPQADGLEWQKNRGRLGSFKRWADLDDPAGFAELFAGDAATWNYSRSGRQAVLELVPTRGSRATRRIRERVERAVAAWAADYAAYVAAARALDAYAAERPDRARAVWCAAFAPACESRGERLSAEEDRLALALGDKMGELARIFDPMPPDGFSIDELVRLVFHPFRARIGVTLPVDADEAIGFERGDEGEYSIPELSLDAALAGLAGRWLEPDPLSSWVEQVRRAGGSEMDVSPLATGTLARGDEAPTADEVRAELGTRLRPAPSYRLAWTLPRDPDSDGGEGGER